MKTSLKHILGLGFKAFAQDAEPEEVARAAEMVAKEEEKEQKDCRSKDSEEDLEKFKKRAEDAENELEALKAKDRKGKDSEEELEKKELEKANDAEPNEHAAAMQEILEALNAIEGRIAKLESSEAAEASPEESLDAFVKELEEGKKEGEDVDKEDLEELRARDADVIQPVEELEASEIPKNPIPGADSLAVARMIRAIKPHIAAIKDPVQKRAACDALLKAYRPTAQRKTTYADMLKVKSAQDAKTEKRVDNGDFGKEMKDKFHRKPITR